MPHGACRGFERAVPRALSPPIRRASAGRRYPEPASRTRTPFARDRDRIIHTSAFRRLKEKTQVFVAHEGDHFRTRLTHSLEVAQIARSLAAALGLDADLAEAIALAHDLGHPPFGHAGEDELERRWPRCGGFDHNVQTFRVVTELERRYPDFDGLNLTWETLEGVVKHNGPVDAALDRPAWRAIADFNAAYDLELGSLRLGRGPGRGHRRRHRLQQPRRRRRPAGRPLPAWTSWTTCR